ncbi:MAG: extracellular solute-binding protein, partial [Candidatus Rifleibacteriota bacterium]
MKNSLRQTLILLTILLSFVGMIHARELTFWNFWDPRLIGPVIERFEKENPGVKIISEQIPWGNGFDKIVVALANGRAPDICELGSTWMGRFINEKAVLELTLELQDLKSDYLMWEPVTDQGKIYGMP